MKKPTVRMRKPPAAPAPDLEAFVAGDQAAPAKGKGKRSKTPGASERCIAEGKTMSATLEAWVAGYIAKR
jgi:hypothetical protein